HAFNFLSKNISDANTDVMQVFTFLGTHTFLIPANLALIAWFLFIKKHRWYSINVPVVAISSLLLMFILKMIFHRDRPLTPLLQAAQGYSFPSGHATKARLAGIRNVWVPKNVNTCITSVFASLIFFERKLKAC
ncbi:MAG: hypothetical protein ABIQ07_00745, partial [Ginsengibacter sp.]